MPAIEIEPSVAMRKPTPKKRGSRIGFLIDPFRRRQVWFESGLEEGWASVMIAHPRVREVREQQTIQYGANRHYTFDLVITWSCGYRIAYAMKYVADVDEGLVHTLQQIAREKGDSFADEYRILTEADIHPTDIANAKLVISCGTDFDSEGRDLVCGYLEQAGEYLRLSEIVKYSGLGMRGYRAAVSLLQSGVLVGPEGMSISPALVVRNRFAIQH